MVGRTRWTGMLVVLVLFNCAAVAWAQKSGGTLRIALREGPGSPSLIEESSIYTNLPFMGVFNNLVLFDQQDKIARPESIKPELATEWAWSADNKSITFKLREGVKWHDGKPFTSADVKCTWDTILGKRDSGWRKNVRKAWYSNLKEVTVNGPNEVKFELGRPQPSMMSPARGRLVGGVSVSCRREGHAAKADRHRALQVRRIQAERNDPLGEEYRVLEARRTVPRRYRVSRHAEPVDAHALIRRGSVRCHRSQRCYAARPERHPVEGAQSDMRDLRYGREFACARQSQGPRRCKTRGCVARLRWRSTGRRSSLRSTASDAWGRP
jgi:hypothetical protein